jgi:hypothetical protein
VVQGEEHCRFVVDTVLNFQDWSNVDKLLSRWATGGYSRKTRPRGVDIEGYALVLQTRVSCGAHWPSHDHFVASEFLDSRLRQCHLSADTRVRTR